MSNDKNDFFLHSNEVNHIAKEDYDKIELLVNTAKAFARSTYQCVYILTTSTRVSSMPLITWRISAACNLSNSWRLAIRCISTMCQSKTCRCCWK